MHEFTADSLSVAEEQREASKERQRLLQVENGDDIRVVMSYPGGRRFMWRLIDSTGFWRSSFTGDRNGTDFREGMRNVGLMLWAQLQNNCPELVLRMQEENR